MFITISIAILGLLALGLLLLWICRTMQLAADAFDLEEGYFDSDGLTEAQEPTCIQCHGSGLRITGIHPWGAPILAPCACEGRAAPGEHHGR